MMNHTNEGGWTKHCNCTQFNAYGVCEHTATNTPPQSSSAAVEEWEKEFDALFQSRGKQDAPYPVSTERFLEWQSERDRAIKSFFRSRLTKLVEEARREAIEQCRALHDKPQEQ